MAVQIGPVRIVFKWSVTLFATQRLFKCAPHRCLAKGLWRRENPASMNAISLLAASSWTKDPMQSMLKLDRVSDYAEKSCQFRRLNWPRGFV